MKKSRTFRKSFVAAIAALCLAAPLAVMPMTVSADTTYSITITPNDSATTHKYVAYQIFAGDYDGTVLSNIQWGSGVKANNSTNKTLEQAIQAISVTEDNQAVTPFSETTGASAIAAKLSDYAYDTEVVQKFAEVVGDYLDAISGASSANGVTGLSAGYYLVQDEGVLTTGTGAKTRYILEVAGTNVNVDAKSSYPTIVKKVKENTDVDDYDINGDKNISTFDTDEYKNYNDVADYNIGDDVPFIDIGTLPDTLEDYDEYYYEIVDTSAEGLDPNTTLGENGIVTDGVTVKIDGVDVTNQATITEETNGQTGETTIKVVFEDIKSVTSVNVTEDSIVTVEYTAKLDDDAEIGLDGQESKVELNFSNDPNEDYDSDTDENRPDGIGTTPEDKVIVFTYELDITKQLQVTAGGDTYTPANTTNTAGFKIYNADNKVARVTEIKEGDSVTGYRIIAWDDTEDTSNNSKKYQMENIANGKVNIVGLDEGKYTVKETKTPNGYNTKEETIVLITADTLDTAADVGNVDARQAWSGVRAADALTDLQVCVDGGEDKKGNVNTGVVEAEIQNNKGSSLPSTGGIGTTIFYLGGGTMAAVAGVYLITKKRMKNEEDDEI